jgi:hypothetical protein
MFTLLFGCSNTQIIQRNPIQFKVLDFRVGGLIIVANRPREQKKNKVNICSILVNRKKKKSELK